MIEKLIKDLQKNLGDLKLITWEPNINPGPNEFAIKNFEFKNTYQFILTSHCDNFEDIVNYLKDNSIGYEVVRIIDTCNGTSSSSILFEKKVYNI